MWNFWEQCKILSVIWGTSYTSKVDFLHNADPLRSKWNRFLFCCRKVCPSRNFTEIRPQVVEWSCWQTDKPDEITACLAETVTDPHKARHISTLRTSLPVQVLERLSLASPCYGALGHLPPRLPTIYFFQFTLELHRVWQRLCAAASLFFESFVCDK